MDLRENTEQLRRFNEESSNARAEADELRAEVATLNGKLAAAEANGLARLVADIRSIKDQANENAAGSPPAGYDELGHVELLVADECYRNGLDAMETALLNWIHDQQNSAPVRDRTDLLAAQKEAARLREVIGAIRQWMLDQKSYHQMIDSNAGTIGPNRFVSDLCRHLGAIDAAIAAPAKADLPGPTQ